MKRTPGDKAPSKRKADARRAIIAAYDRYVERAASVWATPSQPRFMQGYHARGVGIDDWVYRVFPTLHLATFERWIALRGALGERGLAGNYGNRLGSGIFNRDDTLRDFVVAMLTRQPDAKAEAVLKAIETQFEGGSRPTLRVVQRFLREVKYQAALRGE